MAIVPSQEALRLAEAALDEIAPAGAVGDVVDAADEQGVLALRYQSLLAGYPDWLWTVTLATDDAGAQTVLEVALLPGEGSLVAPDWVPWADRLADYLAAKEAAQAEDDDDADDDDADDEESDDESEGDDFDDFDEGDLAAGDEQDGVDVDDALATADDAASASDEDEAAGR
ncbi:MULTISPECIES: DUF3027 domain-containing protein [unclassified Agrococcus]|uniref:DUF3027 domain-containing protein n=1 Tax=unclassified Agrococcus TaxID=2615065 RepID=UPI00361DE74C